MDPRTGMPARDVQSVTIVSDDATMSDALSTGVFIMGARKGLSFVKRMDKVYAVIVDKSGNVLTTSGLILEK